MQMISLEKKNNFIDFLIRTLLIPLASKGTIEMSETNLI